MNILVLDTESTITNKVYDFAFIVYNMQTHKIVYKFACLVHDNIKDELFYNYTGFFSKNNLKIRHENYNRLFSIGHRCISNVNYINRLLIDIHKQYKPTLTAYNLNFDIRICQNSGIDFSLYNRRFCLWHSAVYIFAERLKFVKFCFKFKYLTPKLNLKTNAEVLSHYVTGEKIDEPHTAYEDILMCELPILQHCIAQKRAGWKNPPPYKWQNHSINEVFKTLGINLE